MPSLSNAPGWRPEAGAGARVLAAGHWGRDGRAASGAEAKAAGETADEWPERAAWETADEWPERRAMADSRGTRRGRGIESA